MPRSYLPYCGGGAQMIDQLGLGMGACFSEYRLEVRPHRVLRDVKFLRYRPYPFAGQQVPRDLLLSRGQNIPVFRCRSSRGVCQRAHNTQEVGSLEGGEIDTEHAGANTNSGVVNMGRGHGEHHESKSVTFQWENHGSPRLRVSYLVVSLPVVGRNPAGGGFSQHLLERLADPREQQIVHEGAAILRVEERDADRGVAYKVAPPPIGAVLAQLGPVIEHAKGPPSVGVTRVTITTPTVEALHDFFLFGDSLIDEHVTGS